MVGSKNGILSVPDDYPCNHLMPVYKNDSLLAVQLFSSSCISINDESRSLVILG